MQTATTNRVVFLDYLKAIAIFGVMIIHASESAYSDGTVNFVFKSDSDHLSIALLSGFVRSCVPLFIMASAYLLIPIKREWSDFLKHRFTRIVLPFLFWLLMYAFLPFLWGGCDAAQLKDYLSTIWYNTIPPANHLWFVYMFIGLTLLMPILSAWLKSASRREEEFFLVIWALTTFIELFHSDLGCILGEMPSSGYEYGTFYYFTGYAGYIVLAHYIRNHIDWSTRKTVSIGLPLLLIGYGLCAYTFYSQSYSAETVGKLEFGWNNCGTPVAMMTTGMFLIVRKISWPKGITYKAINDLSVKSFGMYLVHMMFLPFVYSWLSPLLPTPLTIICTAAATYIISYAFVKTVSYLPKSKYFIG